MGAGRETTGDVMGWQDRNYGNESYGDSVSTTRGLRRPPNAALTLMILHGAALLLVLMLRGDANTGVVSALTDARIHPAGILLHPFATVSLFSIVFVLLALWSLGGRLESRLGAARLVELYVLGNLLAGAAYFGIVQALPTVAAVELDYPVGALAAMCVCGWQHLRQDPVQILGRVTTAGTMYAVCGAIAVGLVVLGKPMGALPWVAAAAVGGAAAPLVEFIVHQRAVRRSRVGRSRRPISSPKSRPVARDEPEIDAILAKISRSGLDSLTEAERAQLDAARRAKLRRG